MKNSFSIMETIISVLLLSVAIGTLLQTKDNNLYILSSMEKRGNFDSLISIHTITSLEDDRNINFKEFVSFEDDDVRKKLKDEKVKFKRKLEDKLEMRNDNIILGIEVYQEIYSSEKYGDKKFYRVKLSD